MKLMLSENEASASEELKAILGFVDADFNFGNMIPDLMSATEDFLDVFGKEVYDYIYELYENPSGLEEPDKSILYTAKNAIYTKAYSFYAPINDLAHTNSGRKMRNEEHEKSAFEWMIHSSDEQLDKRYYRAINSLINILDNSKTESELPTTIYTIWTTSDSFKETQKCFIRTLKEFSKEIVIDNGLLFLKLVPIMLEAEQLHIAPIITQAKYHELKTKLKDATPIENSKDLEIIAYAKKAIANYAFANALMKFPVSLLPNAVVQSYQSDRQTLKASAAPVKMERELATQSYYKSFDAAMNKLMEITTITPTPEDVPLYDQPFSDKSGVSFT